MENKEFEKLFNYAKSVDFKISDLAVEDKAHLFILKYKDIDLSLEQQLQKAEAEVKRLRSLIEEENKPKVGLFYNLIKKDALIGVLDSEAYLDGKKIYTMVGLPCIYHNFEPMDKQQLIEWYDARSTKN